MDEQGSRTKRTSAIIGDRQLWLVLIALLGDGTFDSFTLCHECGCGDSIHSGTDMAI